MPPFDQHEQVGARVRRLRKARGWTASELARRAKMDRAHLKRIEDGDYRVPRPENLEKLAGALNCDVMELTGQGPTRQLTPYDANPSIRQFVDRLVELDPQERMRFEELLGLFALALRDAPEWEQDGVMLAPSETMRPSPAYSRHTPTTPETEPSPVAVGLDPKADLRRERAELEDGLRRSSSSKIPVPRRARKG